MTKNDQIEGKTPYVSSTSLNNGIDGFIGNEEQVRIFSRCISLANSWSVGKAFFHQYTFIGSDHITALQNPQFEREVYLFMLPLIERLGEKYSFNREINDARLKREKILLPVDKKGKIDFEFMKKFILKAEQHQLLKIYEKFKGSPHTHTHTQLTLRREIPMMKLDNFKAKPLGRLFDINTWKDLIINQTQPGNYPVITHSKENNWIGFFSSLLPKHHLFNHKTTLSLADRGNFFATKQPYQFYIGTRVKALTKKSSFLKENNTLFLAQMINQQEDNFSYARVAWARLPFQKILIPHKDSWEINWEWMSNFIEQSEFCMIANYLLYLPKINI